jgi:thermolabile hemolysin
MKLPDVSRAPAFAYKTNGTAVAAQVVELNTRLADLVASLSSQYRTTIRIKLYNTYGKFNDLLDNPAAYQMTNTTQPCLGEMTSNSPHHYLIWHPECSTPNSYVFWDNVHPTTRVHKLLADDVTLILRNGGWVE